jgi:two-component system response regulator DesR
MKQTTIFLAESQQFVRDAMCLLLENQCEFSVIGETDSGDNLLTAVDGLCPKVILLDWFLPGLDPHKALHTLRQQCPNALILATSVRPELKAHIQQFDIDGFLSKQLSPNEFIDHLKELIETKEEKKRKAEK